MRSQGRLIGGLSVITSLCLTLQAAPKTFPFVGKITGDNVYVRCGPDTNYYQTGKLHKDDQIIVRGEKTPGWYSIDPPDGSFSWIRSDLVELIVGSQYRTSKDRVRIRAGMPKSNVMYKVQAVLERGYPLEKISEQKFGDGHIWYRVKPPRGVELFIAKQLVEHVKPYDQNQSVTLGKTRPKPKPEPPAPAVRLGARKVLAKVTPKKPVESDQATRLFRAAELAYNTVRDKGLADWNFTSPKKQFGDVVKLARSETLKGMASQRLKDIQRDELLKHRYDSVDAIGTRKSARVLAAETNYVELLKRLKKDMSKPRIDGAGTVRTVQQALGRDDIKYQLLGPTGDVRALLISPKIKLAVYLNQRVGVRGSVEYLADLDARLIRVQEVIAIDASDHP